MKIIPTKYYSGLEAQKILGIKSRQYIAKYIDEGFLIAIQTGEGKHKRYSILGEDLIDFQKRYKKGLTKKITKEQINSTIKKLETLKEQIK